MRTQTASAAQPAIMLQPGPLLARLRIKHGPPDVLGPFYLRAEAAARERDVVLEFGDFDDLARVNEEHYDSWGRLVTMFDPRVAAIPKDKAFCIVGRNHAGEIVTVQAARLFDFTGTTLAAEVENNNLFYPLTSAPEGETCVCTAPIAQTLTGLMTYSGALWIRPDYRGRTLSPLVSRITRSYAASIWGTSHVVSFARYQLVENGTVTGYGYKHFEPAFHRAIHGRIDYEGCVVWVTADEIFQDLREFQIPTLVTRSQSSPSRAARN